MIGSRFVGSAEYELLEKLGEGGMGEVYKARQRGPSGFSRIVVIKQILPDFAGDARFTEMFLAEAQLTARLQHPNIVQVLNLGHGPNGFFLASEYVAGQPLSHVVAALDGRQPPVGLGAFVVRDVCRALSYAYDLPGDDGQPLRLVHRDVSPSNVMIGLDGVAKLLDFGVAKTLTATAGWPGSPPTETGVVKGKLWYMAPERLVGARFDHRADLFSAGVVLYETLTGTRLYTGESPTAIASMMQRPVPPPSRSNPEVPPALDRICLRALEIEPAKRFATGRQMAAALDAVLFELKWGSEELAQLMRDLFSGNSIAPLPGEPTDVEGLAGAPVADTVPLVVPRDARDSDPTQVQPAPPSPDPVTAPNDVAATFDERTTVPFHARAEELRATSPMRVLSEPEPETPRELDQRVGTITTREKAIAAPAPGASANAALDDDDDDTTTASRELDVATTSWPGPADEQSVSSNAKTVAKPTAAARRRKRLIIVALLALAGAAALAASLLWPHAPAP